MKKKLLFVIPLFALLVACGNNKPESQTDSKSETSEEEVTVTETGEITESDTSEESTSEESTPEESTEEEEAKLATLGFDDFPAPVDGNNYPADSTITSQSGVSFNIGGAMQNTGKFKPVNTVQFRSVKKGDAGYVQNTTPVKGQLTIVIMKNYVEYNQTDMSGELTVSVHDKDGKNEKVLEVVSFGDVDGKYHFTYEATSEHYYDIKNLSDYAVYATDMLWE